MAASMRLDVSAPTARLLRWLPSPVAECAVLEKMGAKVQAHNAGVPVVERDTWHLADGFIFGSGTRFGMMTAREYRGGSLEFESV
jgi:hypothetical protein